MGKNTQRGFIGLVASFLLCVLFFGGSASAELSTSNNYRLDASVNNSFGGQLGSANYGLVDSGGESVIGNGASGSYILAAGYSSQLTKSIQLVVNGALNLGATTAGTSISNSKTLTITTDAPGYTVAISQDHDLQNGTKTISPVSGTISSPVTWNEGSTKGLGFTLADTNATAIPAKWASGTAFAATPQSATGIYTRTGFSGGAADTLRVKYRLDVAASQASGDYSNTVTWTATTTP